MGQEVDRSTRGEMVVDPGTVWRGGWRAWIHGCSARLRGHPDQQGWLSWIPGQRLAIGAVPTQEGLARLRREGVTHVVNCRASLETWLAQDLAMERAAFGASRVAHAPMWDTGRPQHPRRWSAAARFAAAALDHDSSARVFVHCQAGVHRSALVAYAVLRLRGHTARRAAELVVAGRREAELLPAYVGSVEDWLATESSSSRA